MVYWLAALGVSSDIIQNVIDMVNAGLSVASVLSFLSTLGLGAGLLAALKGIAKKKGVQAIAA
ncbi:MAG: hypothetical protein E7214_03290 [Clostridium sp.]|nr:hypothetical protein [Clostridium sp.]